MNDKTLADCIGNTPMVRLTRLPGIGRNRLYAKLEGTGPGGSVKDRPAYSMIRRAQERGEIRPGDTLIEATSGNTGIALAMVAAMLGYRLRLIMPAHMSAERRATMKAFGAEIILVTQEQGMEGARDLAEQMEREGQGKVLNQFANPDNPRAHYEGTGPEIWRDTAGQITHFVATMGTTGTIMGTSRYLKERNPAVQIIGVQPDGDSSIPGIRKWPEPYLPKIFDRSRVDRIVEVSARDAEQTTRELARVEGLFCGPSSGGGMWTALQLCRTLEDATIVCIVCDRGDRYISTGLFPD
jgi:cysteine synthase B